MPVYAQSARSLPPTRTRGVAFTLDKLCIVKAAGDVVDRDAVHSLEQIRVGDGGVVGEIGLVAPKKRVSGKVLAEDAIYIAAGASE